MFLLLLFSPSSYHLFLCFYILFYPFLASSLLSIQLILVRILQLALNCTTIYPFWPSVYFSVRVTARKRYNCQDCSLFVNQLRKKETYHPSHFIIEILPSPPPWIPSGLIICTRLPIWISVVCGSGLESYYDVVRPKEWQSNQGYHCVCKRKSTLLLDEINLRLLVDVDPSSPMTAPPPTSSYWDRLDRYRKNYAQNPLWAFLWSGSGIFLYLQITDFSTYTTA